MPKYKSLSAREIVALGRDSQDRRLDVRTVQKHLDRLGVFFNEAVRRREMAHNPLAGLRLKTTQAKYEPTKRSFRPDELRLLFDPQRRALYAAAEPLSFWLPLLALFTGARLNELARLTTHNLTQEAGVWGIHIVAQRKTTQSKRFIPLPERLLALGLVDYARDVRVHGFTDLFPGGSATAKNGPGDTVSRWFNRSYLERVCGITDPEVSFHSFRHTVSTVGDQLGFTETQMGRITGHAPRSVQAKFYIDPKTIPERRAIVNAVADHYDLPRLAAYEPGQFGAFFEELAIKARHAEAAAKRAKRSGAKQ
jgi:integrase